MRVQKLLACSLWRSITFAPIFFEQAARKKRATWYRFNLNSEALVFTSRIQVQWSLLFYTLENYESELGDPELGQALVQLALAALVQQEVRITQIELLPN